MSYPNVRLRGHHIPCLLTHVGVEEGHGEAAKDNIDFVIARISVPRSSVLIVSGADDICAPRNGHQCKFGVEERCAGWGMDRRDQLALEALNQLFKDGGFWAVNTRHNLTEGLIGGFRNAARQGLFERVCRGCGYEDFCAQVRRDHYAGVKLYPPDRGGSSLVLGSSLATTAGVRL